MKQYNQPIVHIQPIQTNLAICVISVVTTNIGVNLKGDPINLEDAY